MIERGLSSSAARKRFTARSPAPYFTNSSASSSALSTSPLISVFDCTSLIVSPSLARQDRTKTKDQRPACHLRSQTERQLESGAGAMFESLRGTNLKMPDVVQESQ